MFCSVLKFTKVAALHMVTIIVHAACFMFLFDSITTVDHKMARFFHFPWMKRKAKMEKENENEKDESGKRIKEGNTCKDSDSSYYIWLSSLMSKQRKNMFIIQLHLFYWQQFMNNAKNSTCLFLLSSAKFSYKFNQLLE